VTPGSVLTLVDKVKHVTDDGITITASLGKRCGTKVLLLELEGDKDRAFDLDVVMAKLGWVRKDLAGG
jgi:hypothetical protein